jgi:hypothetical protein
MRKLMWSLLAVTVVLVGCSDTDDGEAAETGPEAEQASDDAAAETVMSLRGPGLPTEFVGLTTQMPVDREQFDEIASQLFGADAAEGSYLEGLEVGSGLTLSSAAHPDASDQVALEVQLDTTGTEPVERTVARVPASLTTGKTFIDAVDAAMVQTETVAAEDPEGLRAWQIEYRATSAQGGKVHVGVVFDPADGTHLELQADGPTTSLLNDRINQAAAEGAPYETIYGLVWFDVGRDEFDFFANRAYGISAGKSQNFKDFELVPHNWLRLTVEPQLDQDRVSVGFEVITVDGRRVPVAKAPASLIAGEQFMQTVFRMSENMAAQEAAEPGSSTPWEVPFYYDDPDGGGIVEVIAQGKDGRSQIAYAVESPANELDDLPFVPYVGEVEVPDDWDAPPPDCADIGATAADEGRFELTFSPSTTVRGSDLKAPLRGTVYGSVYRAQDVKITGPLEGTEPVASFRYEDVDVVDGPSEPYELDADLPAGTYQVLGFLDIDGTADADAPDPDAGDPVMIPIGGYELACDVQPTTVEFAIVLPSGF